MMVTTSSEFVARVTMIPVLVPGTSTGSTGGDIVTSGSRSGKKETNQILPHLPARHDAKK